MLKKIQFLAVVVSGFLAAQGVFAASAYSNLDLNETCTRIEPAETFEDSARWSCQGYNGIPVYVAEGDLRFFVSFGEAGPAEKAATQSLGPWNRLGSTIEWVLEGGEPVATILRWHTDVPEGVVDAKPAGGDGIYRGQVLVITQLGQGKTCHVGYVDARANKDANQLARDSARLLAGIWDCASEPKILGHGGLSLGLRN